MGIAISLPNLSVQVMVWPCLRLGDGEDEGAAVRVAAAPRVPVLVGDRAEPRVFRGKALEGRVDGLLLRADEADLEIAFLKGKDLGPQHGRIRDADQLELALPAGSVRAMMKNQGPSGEPWIWVAWICR